MVTLTRDEAAKRVGIGASTLRRWVASGVLTATPDGLIEEADLLDADQLMRSRRGAPRKASPVDMMTAASPDIGDERVESDHMKAVREFDALTRAAEVWPPPCRGDARWVTDYSTPADRAEMAEKCLSACLIRLQCDAYARKARPLGGLWAGMFYTPPSAPTKGSP